MGVARTRTTAQATAEGLRVFVAGVPWHISEDVLRRDFEECGVVEDLFLLRDQDGNSKGRCFITFRDAAAVQAALKYDSTEYGGRTIYVKIAEEKRGVASPGTQAATLEKPPNCMSLCLKNIGDASEADLRKFLEGRAIKAIRVLSDRDTGAPRGVAFVDFESTEDVDRAMKKNGKNVKENAVRMSYVDQKSTPQASKRDKSSKFPEEKPGGCTCLCFKNLGDATEDDIWKFADGLDVQAVRLCYDRVSGLSRGIAFVDFPTTEEVDKAMQRNGKELKGCAVQMHFEAPRERPYPEGCMTVAVKKLPSNALEYDVRKLFKGLKSLIDVRVICDKSEACTGLAFAEFASVADVKAAVRRDGMSVHGQVVFICYETKQKKERNWDVEQEARTQASETKQKNEGHEDAGHEVATQKSKKRKLKGALTGEQGQEVPEEEENPDEQTSGSCAQNKKKQKRKAKRAAVEEAGAQPDLCEASTTKLERHEDEEDGADESLTKAKKVRRKTKKADKRKEASAPGCEFEVDDPKTDVQLDVASKVRMTKSGKTKKRKLALSEGIES